MPSSDRLLKLPNKGNKLIAKSLYFTGIFL